MDVTEESLLTLSHSSEMIHEVGRWRHSKHRLCHNPKFSTRNRPPLFQVAGLRPRWTTVPISLTHLTIRVSGNGNCRLIHPVSGGKRSTDGERLLPAGKEAAPPLSYPSTACLPRGIPPVALQQPRASPSPQPSSSFPPSEKPAEAHRLTLYLSKPASCSAFTYS